MADFNVNVSDSVTVLETLPDNIPSESLSVTEFVSDLLSSTASISDSVTLTESVGIGVTRTTNVSETVTISESTQLYLLSISVSESVVVSESVIAIRGGMVIFGIGVPALTVTLEAIVGSTVYNLSDYTDLSPASIDGFGMPPLHRIKQNGPMQHGVTDVGFRLDPRTISLVLNSRSDDEWNAYRIRQVLLEVFKPSDDPIKLRYTYMSGTSRQIDVFYESTMTMPTEGIWYGLQKIGIGLYAPDPVWSATTGSSTIVQPLAATPWFRVPVPVPFGIGPSEFSQSFNITYSGTWMDYPKIKIFGPCESPRIENVTTGEKLDFSGVRFSPDTRIEIDCRYGYKTIVNASGTNYVPYLSYDSDLATFHIAADPEVSAGVNQMLFVARGANDRTKVQIDYTPRYIGL